MYINRYTYEGGNPFLLPSLSHNITLGTTYKWVYLSAGYQYVKDAIISFSGAYSEGHCPKFCVNGNRIQL